MVAIDAASTSTRSTLARSTRTQRLVRAALRRPVRRLWSLQQTGAENVPASAPAILCPNHLSFFDSVVMLVAFDRPVHFIGKADYLDSWRTRWLFPALGMIPIDRDGGGTRAMIALDAAAGVLRGGGLLCIYPEGSRSRDGRLHRGHSGAARLATSVGCPIVPIGLIGTDRVQPTGTVIPRLGPRVTMAIGAPIVAGTEAGTGSGARRPAARALTDEVMRHIAHLSGQEYVAQYTRTARRTPTAPRGRRVPSLRGVPLPHRALAAPG